MSDYSAPAFLTELLKAKSPSGAEAQALTEREEGRAKADGECEDTDARPSSGEEVPQFVDEDNQPETDGHEHEIKEGVERGHKSIHRLIVPGDSIGGSGKTG